MAILREIGWVIGFGCLFIAGIVTFGYFFQLLGQIKNHTERSQDTLEDILKTLKQIESHTEATSGNTWRITPEGHEHHHQIDDARF